MEKSGGERFKLWRGEGRSGKKKDEERGGRRWIERGGRRMKRGGSILVCFVGSLVKEYHPPTVKR